MMSVHDTRSDSPVMPASTDVDDQFATNLTNFLTCSVCTKIFTEPRTLPCCHSFCKACLPRGKLATVSCPICETSFDTQEIPQAESKIIVRFSKLLEVIKPIPGYGIKFCGNCGNKTGIPPSIFCQECNFFSCSECFESIHKKWKPMENHHSADLEKFKITVIQLCEISSYRVESRCSNHNMLLEHYCGSCQELVCSLCISEHEDKGHETPWSIINYRIKYKNAVNKVTEHVDHEKIRLERNIQGIDKKKEKITSRGKAIKDEIRLKLKKLEEDLLSQVSDLVGRKIANLDAQIELVNEEVNSLTKYIKTVKDKLQEEDYEELKELLMKTYGSSEEEVSHGSSEEEVSSSEEEVSHEAIETIRNTPVESANLVRLAVDVSSVKLEIEQENSIMIKKKFHDAEIVSQPRETPIVNKSCTWVVSLKQSFGKSPLPAQNLISYLDPFTTTEQPSSDHQKTGVQCEVKSRDEEGLYEITFTPCVSGPHVLKMRYRTEPATSHKYADIWVGEISLNVLIEPIYAVLDKHGHGIKGTMGEQVTTTASSIVSNQHDVYILNKSHRKVHIGYIIDDGISKGCRPKGIDHTSEGNVVLVMYDLHRVKEVSVVDGKDVHCFEETGDGQLQFKGPTVVAVDRRCSKKIFIVEKGNQRIQVLNSDFTFSHFIQRCPSDMAFDSKGHLYTIDENNSQNVTVIDIRGRELRVIKLEDMDTTQPNVERVLHGITINKNDLMLITSSEHDKQSKKELTKSSNTEYTSDGRKIITLAKELKQQWVEESFAPQCY